MADAGRIVPAEIGAKIELRHARISLKIKTFAVIAPAIALPVVVALIFRDGEDISFLAWLRTFDITLFGVAVPFQALILVAVAVAAAVGADMLFSRIVYDKIDALARWSREFRAAEFARVPVLPRLSRDEIGDLGTELGASAAHFLRMREEAGTAAEEKSVFLTITAHQLRTPLTAVSWSIDSLLDPHTSAEDKQKILPQLNGELKRMLLVTGHILASAKIEEGKFGFVFGLSDIVPIIDALVKDFQPLADEKKITLAFEHPAMVPPVYMDPERISLALFDLIENAIDYSHTGAAVTIVLAPHAERVEVSIEDTGIGIAAQDIPHLFTKFYRGANARHARPDGTGLGLYLVKNIIMNHGSDIAVQSDETKGGTRVSFTLPTQKI